MARKDERGVMIPAPVQFNNPASASLPRYDDEHRGPAVTDSYELSHCRIDLAERSEGWPTPANLPSRMVDFAQSVPEDQRANWLRRQANIEEAERHIANAMQSGELPIWVAPIGEPERLVAPGAFVEVDHATVVSGVYRPRNDRGWLYGRPLFVKRDDWAIFAARIDAAKKPMRKYGKSQSRSHDGDERQWLRISKAVCILQRILRTRLAGQEPAPWIDPPADPFDAECENATHRHRRTARTSLTMRRALLAGDLTAHLVKDGRSHPLPGWAWENASAAENAFYFDRLPLDPLLDHNLGEFSDWRCFVSHNELKKWLARPEIAEIGDLPTLPEPFDHKVQPVQLSYREPPNRPYVELTQAVTWIAFAISLSRDEFDCIESFGFGPAAKGHWQEALGDAMTRLAAIASDGTIGFRGRYLTNVAIDQNTVLTELIDPVRLEDFAQFDNVRDGLRYGAGLTWSRENNTIERALQGRRDAFVSVRVNRAELLTAFPPKTASLTTKGIATDAPETPAHQVGVACELSVSSKLNEAAPKLRKGRAKGTGYQQADAPLLEKMREAIAKNPALNATSAAKLVANEAVGASFEAKVDRLSRAFRAGRNRR
ncbi:hypothetical protein [Aurantiacibacter flavus]|uniref:Uncharacterized protein n=1 Tax=Aurantiacibacter flavus TaxID=3145232 RepID=A0ABV0CWE5_9SPHN